MLWLSRERCENLAGALKSSVESYSWNIKNNLSYLLMGEFCMMIDKSKKWGHGLSRPKLRWRVAPCPIRISWMLTTILLVSLSMATTWVQWAPFSLRGSLISLSLSQGSYYWAQSFFSLPHMIPYAEVDLRKYECYCTRVNLFLFL